MHCHRKAEGYCMHCHRKAKVKSVGGSDFPWLMRMWLYMHHG